MKLRKVILVPLIIVVVFVGTAAVSFHFTKPVDIVVPVPNGHDDLVQAAAMVNGLDSLADLKPEQWRQLIATNTDALNLVRAGLKKQCAVPTRDAIANFSNITTELIGLKTIARLLVGKGRLAETENRPVDAAKCYITAIHLGVAMSKGGFIINRSVGVVCEAMGCMQLVKVMPKLDCAEMRPMIRELQEIDTSTPDWSEIIRNENSFERSQISNYWNVFKLGKAIWDARHIRAAAKQRHDLAAAQVRLITTELALRVYQCEKTRIATSLNDLVTNELQALPRDPFSNRPLIYHPSPTNWALYSVGPDGIDDGGRRADRLVRDELFFGADSSNPKPGDVFYDLQW